MKRWTTILLILVLLLTLLPAGALADEQPSTDTYCSATSSGQHSWRNWTTTKEATCTQAGSRTRTCGRCGYQQTETIRKKDHSWGKWQTTKEATCAQKGEERRKCSVCGKTDTRETDRKAHTWGEWTIITEATDHTAGERTRVCQVCGREDTQAYDPEGTLRPGARGDEVRALQEELICYGTLTDRADGVYGKKTEQAVRQVQQNEGLEADGIAWPQTRAYTQHLFGDWRTVTKLTRESDGLQERVCARCGVVERDVIKAVPSFKRGDRGKAIEVIQNIIWDMGYKPGTIDGIYGPILDQAIVEWARDHEWYYEPGLIKPIDIDRIVGEWVENDEPAHCAEDTPVQLSIRLTPAVDVKNIRVGQTVKYYWTAINYGEEDCTLGPILYSFGQGNTTQDVRTKYHFVADIDGNLLKADGQNTLTGSLTFVADRDLFDWEASGVGTLYLNAWAIGTSRATGRKWQSHPVTERLFNSNDTDLLLTVDLVDGPKDGYAVDEEVAFRWTLTNRGDEPCTVEYVGMGTLDDQGGYVFDEPVVLEAGGSVSDTCTARLFDDWRYRGRQWNYFGQWWIYFDAWARYESGSVRANEVHFQLPEAREASGLVMTVEQVSPKKAAYAPGDEVTFHWTLANAGAEELKLDYGEVDALGDDTHYPYDEVFTVDPVILPANGKVSAEGDYTITLTDAWMYHGWLGAYDGGFRLRFYAYALSAADPTAYPVRTDSIDIFLPGKAAESDLVLTVAQISPEKEGYAVGEEVVYGWSLTNLGDQDRTLDFIAMAYSDDGLLKVYDAPRTLRGRGASILTGTFTCELSPDLMLDDEWRFDFFARCPMDGEERYLVSNHISIVHRLAGPKPNSLPTGTGMISLRNNVPKPDGAEDLNLERGLIVVDRPKNEDLYYDGAKIPVKLRLTLDEGDEYELTGIDVYPGDSLSDETWMHEPLTPGESYDFTYTMFLDPDQYGWKTRYVRAWLTSKDTGLPEVEECEVRPPFTYATVTLVGGDSGLINDNAAWLYLKMNPGYLGQALSGENLDLPINIDSYGNTEIRDVKLVCEMSSYGKVYETRTFDITDKLRCNTGMDVVKKLYVHKHLMSDDPLYYGLKMYLTGEYLDMKGRVQTVESLPITPAFKFVERSNRARIDLVYTLEPRKPFYSLNDVVAIEFKVRNSGSEAVKDVDVGLDGAYADLNALIGGRQPVNDGAALAPGDVVSTTIQYRIQPQDLIDGAFEAEFFASCVGVRNGASARSPKAYVQLPVAQEVLEENISLSAALTLPRDEYFTGVGIPVRLTLENHTSQRIKTVRIYATGENRGDYLLMNAPWHDFGHGAKGPLCASGKDVEIQGWDSYSLEVLIPSEYRPNGAFHPAWTAEAELEDGTLVRTAAVGLSLPIVQEELEIEAYPSDPGIDLWYPGDEANIFVKLTYTGEHMPKEFRVVARIPRISGTYEVKTQNITDNTAWAIVPVPLTEEGIVDGAWNILVQAGGIRTGTLSSGQVVLSLPAAPPESEGDDPENPGNPEESGAPAEGDPEQYGALVCDDLGMALKPLTESTIPGGWWKDGDKVKTRVTVEYLGAEVPKAIIAQVIEPDHPEKVLWSSSIYNAKKFMDEFELTLDASHAVEGLCWYVVKGWACMESEDAFDVGPVEGYLVFDLNPPEDLPEDLPEGDPITFSNISITDAAKAAIEKAQQKVEPAELAGTWYLNQMILGGGDFSTVEFGVEASFEFHADGSVAISGLGIDDQTNWFIDGNAIRIGPEDASTAFTLRDGNLIAEKEGTTMIFGREKTGTFTPAPVRTEAAAEEFDGAWTVSRISVDGATFDISMIAEPASTATIGDGRLTLTGFSAEDMEIETAFAEGALHGVIEADEDRPADMELTARLLEDGMLCLNLTQGETAETLYFLRDEAE